LPPTCSPALSSLTRLRTSVPPSPSPRSLTLTGRRLPLPARGLHLLHKPPRLLDPVVNLLLGIFDLLLRRMLHPALPGHVLPVRFVHRPLGEPEGADLRLEEADGVELIVESCDLLVDGWWSC
ncbi:hypothetical protein DM02DRAFT_694828, partial [Periconia macrospinosa]